jgi:colanic acid biosynthesis glycosyl transferase WcaI
MELRESKPRIWILSELYRPELTSTGHYITAIAESLTSDLDVHVICAQPNYSARGSRYATRETLNDVQIRRVWSLRLDKNILLFRLLNALSLSVSAWLTAIRNFDKGDRVLVVTTPPLLPLATAAAALMRGTGYTLLVHDVYPEQLTATGILSKGSLIGAMIDLINRWVYKHTERIIVVGRDMQELLEKKTEGLDIPISNIPNWSDSAEITPKPRNENSLLKELGLKDKFVILSAGNFGRPNDLETLVDAAEILATNDRARFLFIGNGAREEWLRNRTEKLKNVTVLPSMAREEQPVFLNACDVTLASLVSGMWGAAVPSRIYNYLAAGKPVIAVCEDGSEMARLVTEANTGLVVASGDSEGLGAAILELMHSPERVAHLSENARALSVGQCSAETALRRYRDILVRTQ